MHLIPLPHPQPDSGRAEEAARRAEMEVRLKLLQERQRVKKEGARLRGEEELIEMTEAL